MGRPIRIAITGSREFGGPSGRDIGRRKVQNFVLGLPKDWVIVSGGAVGPDSWAVEAAKLYNREFKEHLPKDHLYSAKIARMERNRDIADDSDLMVSFWDGSSTGSLNGFALMIRSKKPGKMVRISDPVPTLKELNEMLQLPSTIPPV